LQKSDLVLTDDKSEIESFSAKLKEESLEVQHQIENQRNEIKSTQCEIDEQINHQLAIKIGSI